MRVFPHSENLRGSYRGMALSIADNLIDVRKRLRRAARKAGRDISEITLVAVTKTLDAKQVKAAIKEGLRVFGENYIQEAQEKIKKIGDKQKKWHFIGHLQKNKARFAVELFDCIHTVDTPGLAREINRRTDHTMDVLIQVNISGEKTKHGTTPEGAMDIARLMPELKKLNLRGLMTIPPAVDTPERSRPYFITLRRLAERINRERIPGVVIHDLSMGMSSDFDVAVEEGATMVRVGTAIFGPREPAPEKDPAKKPASTPKKATVTKETKAPVKEKAVKKKTAVKKVAVTKKPASKAKKINVSAKKATVKTKKAVTEKKKSNTKEPASIAKKTAVKKTGGLKKRPAATNKKTAKVTAVKAEKGKKAAQRESAVKAKKAATKKTKTPSAVKLTAPKKKTVQGAKKKAAASKTATKKAAPAITGKKTPKKAVATKKAPASSTTAKKTKKPSSTKKKSS